MKTVITKFLVDGLQRDRGTDNKPIPLYANDYTFFNSMIEADKQNMYEIFRAKLPRGGFVFDPSLWQWTTTGTAYKLELWVSVTWIDNDNVGKSQFMNYIKQTGLLIYNPVIVKPYS